MRISASSLLLRVGTLGGLLLVGCAAFGCAAVSAEMRTELRTAIQQEISPVAQAVAGFGNTLTETRQEINNKIEAVGSTVDSSVKNFDPETMRAVARNSRDAIYMVAFVILFECIVAAVFVAGLFRAVASWLANRKKTERRQ